VALGHHSNLDFFVANSWSRHFLLLRQQHYPFVQKSGYGSSRLLRTTLLMTLLSDRDENAVMPLDSVFNASEGWICIEVRECESALTDPNEYC
jgi:hypothetical protein